MAGLYDEDFGPPEGSRVVAIGVDGRAESDYAFDFYLKYLRKQNDYIILINCPELNELLRSSWNGHVYVFNRERVNEMLEQGKRSMGKAVEGFKEKMSSLKIRGRVKVIAGNNPGQAICVGASDEKASVIILGNRGLGMVRRSLLGSTSDYVVHHAHVPVMICRHPQFIESK